LNKDGDLLYLRLNRGTYASFLLLPRPSPERTGFSMAGYRRLCLIGRHLVQYNISRSSSLAMGPHLKALSRVHSGWEVYIYIMLCKLSWQVRLLGLARTSLEPVLPVSGALRDSPRSQRGGRRGQDLPERGSYAVYCLCPSNGARGYHIWKTSSTRVRERESGRRRIQQRGVAG